MNKFTSDKELVSACLKYKPSAQRALYDKYVNAMYNTVYRYTNNHHDTQDILQNGFSRVFKHLKNYDPSKGELLSWLRRIHIHCALSFLKTKSFSIEQIGDSAFVAEIYSWEHDQFDAEYILRFIEELNPRDRVIFNMYHIEGYGHEEIAELLSINVNSCRVYLAQARKVLRNRITAYNGRISLAQ